jgi:chromosome segregation ATPase
MGAVGRDTVAQLVSHAAELERQDQAVAQRLDAMNRLADRAGELRSRGADVRSALAGLPGERADVEQLTNEARADAYAVREQLRVAEERVAALERSRRRRTDELERARKEALTASELLVDVEARVERLRARHEDLDTEEQALGEEAAGLGRAAAAIAAQLEHLPQVGDAAARVPGTTLAELEDWGFLVRSSLFVARGTLEAERERIVTEANELGAAALGEELGVSSVALVRRRLEAELAR